MFPIYNIRSIVIPSILIHELLLQCKKLPVEEDEEGYVTDEDEGAETEKSKKNNKKVNVVRHQL